MIGAAYTAVTLLSWRRITVNSWDNGIFEQAIKAYAHIESPIVNIKGPGYNILGDHFSPIDALIAPFYRIFPSGATLLVAQVVLLAASVVIISKLALKHLGRGMGGIVSVLYGLSFGLGSAVVVDFHEVAFAVPLLAMAGSAFVDRRAVAVMGWSIPLLLVKEDMGVTVAAIGVALFLIGERKRGAILAAIGAVGLVLTVWVIIPAFNTVGGYDYTNRLGGEMSVLEVVASEWDRKLLTLVITLGITGFACLLSPWAIVAAPTLLWRFVGNVDYYWGTDWHYSVVLMPIVFVAMIDALRRRRDLALPAVAIASVFTGYMLSGSALTSLLEPETWRENPRAVQAREANDAVPDGAMVESDLGLLKYLVSDHDTYWQGTIGDVVPDWIVLDAGITPTNILEYARDKHGVEFEIVYEDGGYSVARRVG